MSDPGIFPYSPKRPPDDINPALGRWAYLEMRDISDALALRPVTGAVLYGGATAMLVDTTRRIIAGYGSEAEGEGFRNAADPTTGVITLPFTGTYQVIAHAGGSHSTATQNDAAMLFIRTPGGDIDMAGWPVATNKVTYATFNGALVLPGNEGDALSLGLYATTSLGTFTFASIEFFVELMDIS